jgi:glycosyltransferase involved in cell wall biosynthesis
MSDPAPIPLSVFVRTKNEEDRIANTINSVAGLGCQILIVDSGSTDRTVEICEALGAKVIFNAWEGYGPQRRFGEMACDNDWLLHLDADEVATPELVAEILALFADGPPPLSFYRIWKMSVMPFHDKPSRAMNHYNLVHLSDRRQGRAIDAPSWDAVQVPAGMKIGQLKGQIIHYSIRDIRHHMDKTNYTTSIEADTQSEKPMWLLWIRLFTEFPFFFFKGLILRRYIFGGFYGLVFTMIYGFQRWLRIAKMMENQKYKNKQKKL